MDLELTNKVLRVFLVRRVHQVGVEAGADEFLGKTFVVEDGGVGTELLAGGGPRLVR